MPIWRSSSGSSSTSFTPKAMRMALLAIPSERAAPRVFMVSTVASKPSFPRTYSPWARAKVVA